MENFDANSDEICLNAGTEIEYSIKELAEMVKFVVEYKGDIEWDVSKPNGMPRKLLDSSRLKVMGWQAKVNILEGVRRTYQFFLSVINQKH